MKDKAVLKSPSDEIRKLDSLLARVEKRLLDDTPHVEAWTKSARDAPRGHYGITKISGRWRLCFSEDGEKRTPLAECSVAARVEFFRSLLALEISLKDRRSDFYMSVMVGITSLEAWLIDREEGKPNAEA